MLRLTIHWDLMDEALDKDDKEHGNFPDPNETMFAVCLICFVCMVFMICLAIFYRLIVTPKILAKQVVGSNVKGLQRGEKTASTAPFIPEGVDIRSPIFMSWNQNSIL